MPIITIAEAAELCGKSQKTIRRAIAAGKLKCTKIQNKTKIERTDFDEWVQNGCCGTEEQDNNSVRNDEVNWLDISDVWKTDGWNKKKDRSTYNFIDLFSGAGGLSCGLVMAGLNPVASVEIMPEAVATYERNFIKDKGFKEKVETRDIREQSVKDNLYASVEGKHIDVIVGGFPCQGFSMSGYRVVDDPRNSLYKEMKDIVEHLQPDFVVMENVEGLRSMLNGKVEEKIINDYKEIGYDINITVLNSADYCTPQTRHRVIFIGNRVGVTNYHPKPLLDEEHYVTVGQALNKYVDMPENKDINHTFTKTSPEMKKRLEAIPIGKSLYSNYSDAWKKVDWNKPSCTVKENHGGVNIHPILSRPMTPRELATLQSFPEDFIFEGSKKWQLVQIGNAVPCLLGKAIGLTLRKMMDDYNKNNVLSEKLRMVSLFSGCGGLDLGFEKAGFDIVFANDFDSDAQAIYKLNLGEIDSRDITTIKANEIPDCDIITAGFPCQPFSNAGNRKGLNDSRGNLFYECIRIIKAKKPKAIVFENVRGLLSSTADDGTLVIDIIKEEVENLGYSVNYQVINASDYQVPQNRIRMIFIAFRNDLNIKYRFPKTFEDKSLLNLGKVLDIPADVPNQDDWPLSPQASEMIKYIPEGGSWKNIPYDVLPERFKKIRDNMERYHSPNMYRRFARNEIAGTITASAQPDKCGIIHPIKNRRFNVREVARIQSFPDDFIFLTSTKSEIQNMYKVIGNAVPPTLAYHIAKSIIDYLKK